MTTAVYRASYWLSQRLPRPTALEWSARCTDAWCAWAKDERAAVAANLSAVLGAAKPEPSKVREVFRNFGRYLVEFFTMHAAPEPKVEVTGLEHLVAARRAGRGVILLTGHLGNWELGALVLKRLGMPMTVVALPHEDPAMDALFNRQRQRCGIPVIPLGPAAARRSVDCLRAGGALGILADREFGRNGLLAPAFDRRLMLPTGPAVLSLRSGSPALPAFLVREGAAGFRLHIEPPIEPPPGLLRAAATAPRRGPANGGVRELVLAYGRVLERYIQRFPEQWLIFQPLLNAR
jgi:KDO2-lipid IV(A) lauroyltransferase